MIEIVAKDYNHFFSILQEYQIAEHKAIFVPWDLVEVKKEKPAYSPPIYETDVKRDSSDWLDYSSVDGC